MQASTKYSMSFTTGTLLLNESTTVAQLYRIEGDWDKVRMIAIEENRLQMRTLNASKRIYREVTSRLRLLTEGELTLLINGDREEQITLAWLAICRRYRFIYDVGVDVVREKLLGLNRVLTYEDYDRFFHDKAEWHPEVEQVAPSTQGKQRQVVFKTMREAGLLSVEGFIQPMLLSPQLLEAIVQDNPADLLVFLSSDVEVREWTARYA